MAAAILYLPHAASRALGARPVGGRSLTLRAAVAAARAGASIVGIPAALRTPRLEREIRRAPDAARAVRWLDGPAPEPGFTERPCLLLPVTMLAEAWSLRVLLEPGGEPEGAVLAGTAARGAPALSAPPAFVQKLWDRLAAGQPLGEELTLQAGRVSAVGEPAAAAPLIVRREADLAEAEARLYARLGTDNDTGVDRFLHRRCSLPLTRVLVRTPATPNQVSLASLAVGGGAIWCFWQATPGSALLGVLLYLVASVLDHSDGELARLTFQESRLGAHLDWAIDTIIHSLLVLAMAVTAGHGPLALAVGAAGAAGVTLSAFLARHLPHEIEVGPSVGGGLKNMGNRDLFYLLLLVFVLLRWLVPALLVGLALLVAVGSQWYWLACLARIRRLRPAGSSGRGR